MQVDSFHSKSVVQNSASRRLFYFNYCKKHVDAVSVKGDDRKFLWKIIEYGKEHVTGKLLWKIIEDCEKHVYAPSTIADDLKAFDANFVKVDQDTLVKLISAANYLNIKSLLNLTLQTVADMIKGILDEIKKTFNIKYSTPEEVEEVLRENPMDYKGL